MSDSTKLRALIDGDILVYRSAAACEQKEYTYAPKEGSTPPLKFRYVKEAKLALGDKISEYTRTHKIILSPPEHCLHSLRHTLEKVMKNTHAGECSIYLGGPNNFRDLIDPKYKAGRGPKPEYYQLARDYLISFHDAEIVHGQEVDDRLAQEQSSNTVICGIDKDMYQVPGCHYNWVTDTWKYLTKEEGDEWFWIQMLVGDGVDNIKGIDGVGLIGAAEQVAAFKGDFAKAKESIQDQYITQFGSSVEFFANIRLLYIRRNVYHNTSSLVIKECT